MASIEYSLFLRLFLYWVYLQCVEIFVFVETNIDLVQKCKKTDTSLKNLAEEKLRIR